MNGQKIMCMTFEHMNFIDWISFLQFPLRKLTSAFGLSSKSWYPRYFNTRGNLNYVGIIPDVTYCSANEINAAERTKFLECYRGQKSEILITDVYWNRTTRMTSQS